MGASTHDLFGTGRGAHAATPGSYGTPPAGFRLPDATRLGAVHLQVGDLARSLAFYRDVLGFAVIGEAAGRATLGAGGRTLIELHEKRGVRPAGKRALLGLYHVAILLPDRAALGRFVTHAAAQRLPLGAGDHLVSEALYLSDPDGLGLEIYADRPRDTWQAVDGELMASSRRRMARRGPACPPAPRWATCTCTWATSPAPRASTATASASAPW
jgi:catechol 2,3-dioxygenase